MRGQLCMPDFGPCGLSELQVPLEVRCGPEMQLSRCLPDVNPRAVPSLVGAIRAMPHCHDRRFINPYHELRAGAVSRKDRTRSPNTRDCPQHQPLQDAQESQEIQYVCEQLTPTDLRSDFNTAVVAAASETQSVVGREGCRLVTCLSLGTSRRGPAAEEQHRCSRCTQLMFDRTLILL